MQELFSKRSLLCVTILVLTIFVGTMAATAAPKLRVVSSISGGKTPEESKLFAKEHHLSSVGWRLEHSPLYQKGDALCLSF